MRNNKKGVSSNPPAADVPFIKSPSLLELNKAGFLHVANWKRNPARGFKEIAKYEDGVGIYVFVAQEKVHYVGESERRLSLRLEEYASKLKTGRSFRKVHKGLMSCKHKETVQILVYPLKGARLVWHDGLPIDRLLGLECGLIEALDPSWNPKGSVLRAARAADGLSTPKP